MTPNMQNVKYELGLDLFPASSPINSLHRIPSDPLQCKYNYMTPPIDPLQWLPLALWKSSLQR